MKKILTVLAISFSALMASSVSLAGPHEKNNNYHGWDQSDQPNLAAVAIFVKMTMTCKTNAVCVKNADSSVYNSINGNPVM